MLYGVLMIRYPPRESISLTSHLTEERMEENEAEEVRFAFLMPLKLPRDYHSMGPPLISEQQVVQN